MPLANDVVVNVGLSVPTGLAPIYHWKDGVEPPPVGVAVNVTDVPAQMGDATSAAMLTLTEVRALTVIVTVLLVAVEGEGQVAFDVITTLTTSPLASVVEE